MDLFMRVMMAAYDERVTTQMKPLFLSSFFGKNPSELVVSTSERVDVDVIRDARRVAVDVIRGAGIGNSNITGVFTTHEYKVPLYWEETPLTAQQIIKRIAGMNNTDTLDRSAILAYHATNAQREQTLKIIREIERMAAEALQSGTITLINTESLDFGKKASHAVTPATKWDAGGNPLTDIQGLSDTLFHDGKMKPNTIIFGESAWTAFLTNAAVIAYLDNRRIEAGKIDPTEIPKGATFQGRVWIGDYQFDMFTYNDFYMDSSNCAVPYMTTDTVIVMNRQAYLTKAFGAVELLPQYVAEYASRGLPRMPEFVPGEFMPFAYERPPNALMVGVQSAPLVVPTAIDTIGTLVNVDT